MNIAWKETLRIAGPLLVVILGVAAFAAIGQPVGPQTKQVDAPAAALVEAVSVREHAGPILVAVDGLVVPYREISVAAEVPGRITFKTEECRAGRFVTAGAKLFEIDPETYRLEVERLEAEKEQARSDQYVVEIESENTKRLIELADRQVELAENELERVRRLQSRRAATAADLDQAIQGEVTARNNLVTLENQVRLLEKRTIRLGHAVMVIESRLKQAKRDLARTTVRAPVDGVVVSDLVEQDGFVKEGDELVVLEDTSAVEVQCNLKVDELSWLWQAAGPPSVKKLLAADDAYELPQVPVTVSYQIGGNEYEWRGKVYRYEGIGLDERTRTVPCRIKVDNPREFRVDGKTVEASNPGLRALLRGMFVDVTARIQPRMALLRLPDEAVKPGNKVWCVRGGRLEILPIDVLWREPRRVFVSAETSGLSDGDQAVVSPLAQPENGMTVRIRETGN